MKSRTERGFTLVELMVVIVLIGLLVGVVGSQVWGVLRKGKNTTAQNQIKELETAAELFYLMRSRYPESLEELLENDPEHGFPTGYLKAKQIPQDPWGQPFVYDPQGGTVQAFLIYSAGADMQEGTADDLTNEPSSAEE